MKIKTYYILLMQLTGFRKLLNLNYVIKIILKLHFIIIYIYIK